MRRLTTVAVLILTLAVAGIAGADWEKGTTAYRNHDYATAEKQFKEVVKTNPEHYAGYYMLGACQLKLKQYSQAVASLQKAVELKGDYVPAQVSLGKALLENRQYRAAYSTFDKLQLSQVPSNQRTMYALMYASAASRVGHASDAAKVLEQQVRADSRNVNLYKALGAARTAQADDAGAFSAFKQAWRLKPSDGPLARQAVSSAIRAARRSRSATVKQRFYDQATSIAEGLAGSQPTFDHLLLAGETRLGSKDYRKALSWFKKARAKSSNSALVNFYIGQCHSSSGSFSRAITALKQALRLGPDGKLRKKIYEQMGYVYAKQKDYDNAITAYQNAGEQAKVAEMRANKKKQEQNQKAKEERREFQRKIRELEAKIKELRDLGQVAQADQLQEQVNDLKKSLKQQ